MGLAYCLLSALNVGIAKSTGDIIITIDADCVVTPSAIMNFVRFFADKRIMAVAGNIRIGNRRTLVGVVQYFEYLFGFNFKRADSLMGTIFIIGGAAAAYRREVFDRLGKFEERSVTEDMDLSMRIQKAGMRVVFAADAIIYTEGASNVRGLIRQRTRWRSGRFSTFNKHRGMFFSFKGHQNKLLSWIIFPFVYVADVQLALEIPFLTFIYAYSLLSRNFSLFYAGMILVGFTFVVQILFGDGIKRVGFLLLAPIGWLLFYLVTYVEVRSLLTSVWQIIRRKENKWQKWSRSGAVDNVSKTKTGTYIVPDR